jgi:putative hydrolase of the HAD superfamily
MEPGVVLWDFDGTLARRPGLWSGCLLEVLDEHAENHTGTLEGIRASLRGGFPWSRHSDPHPGLADADAWWEALTPRLSAAIEGAGVSGERVGELARAMRIRFTDASRGWEVFPDAHPALKALAAAGWRNVILSNHVPELPDLVSELGLAGPVERVFTSATIGYEKPHPDAFLHALRECGHPARHWMVGDNPTADIDGAEAVGIPAILVRSDGRARHTASELMGAVRIITGA